MPSPKNTARITSGSKANITPDKMTGATSPTRSEAVAVGILCASVVLAPLALGSSGTWPRLALETAMTLAVGCWAFSRSISVWLTATPLLVVSLILLQLMPLPDSLLVYLAPVSAGAWKVAHEGSPEAWGRISIDPAATLAAARRLLIGLATIAAVIGLGRYQSYRKKLIAAVSISGALILGLGLIFGHANKERVMLGLFKLAGPLQPNHSPLIMPVESAGVGMADWVTIDWQRYLVDSAAVGDGFGSYIYSNHFAGGVTLTLPVLLAAWLFLTSNRLHNAVRYAGMAVAVVAAAWSVGWIAESRAGVASLVLACITLVAVVVVRPWPRRIAAAMLALNAGAIVLLLVVLLGGVPGVADLVPRAWHAAIVHLLADARTLAVQIAIRMFCASPLLGTGLNTYQDIFPQFYKDTFSLFYAHNDYAQLLAETGIVGTAIAVLLATRLWMLGVRFYREAKGAYRTLNAGPWAAVAGIATHSAFDWNLHLPANAFLACVVVGLSASSVPSRTNLSRNNGNNAFSWIQIPEYVPQMGLVAACVLSLLFLGRDAISDTTQLQLRQAIVTDRLATKKTDRQAAADALGSAIRAGTAMARWNSGSAPLALLLGQAHFHLASHAGKPAAREALIVSANDWFSRAKRRCAILRGVPEPIPKQQPNPQPPDRTKKVGAAIRIKPCTGWPAGTMLACVLPELSYPA